MAAPLEVSRELLALAVDQSHDGITISDASKNDLPLIYVNAGFERMTGYTSAELLGKSSRLLQGHDTDQAEIALMREALHQGENCQISLRNYRKDGSMFWNDLSLSAIRNDQGVLTHYVGIQKDVTARIMPDQRLRQPRTPDNSNHIDTLTGSSDRFGERLDNILQTAQRTHSLLSVLVVNLDQFKRFNERYGRAAGDTCLRMVGERIAHSFARASDCVARHNGNEFVVASMGDSVEGLQQHLGKLRDQVRALNIPHHDSPDGVVTICAGAVSLIPQRDTTAQDLLKQAEAALLEAKRRGHDCEHIA
ncbi:MAG: diguanylate cyclase [Gallionella sp.]|jgi:diguanylate cyclase (GGDEF)-like protein/PAS domain S-box-containing protein